MVKLHKKHAKVLRLVKVGKIKSTLDVCRFGFSFKAAKAIVKTLETRGLLTRTKLN